MRVLLDNNIDHRFAKFLVGHETIHARQRGWQELENGNLISIAEDNGFDVLITGDKNLRYQQNLQGRTISIITLNSRFIDLKAILPLVTPLLEILESLPRGSFITLDPVS